MIPRTAAACWYCKHDEHARCSAPDTCGCWPCHGAAMIDAVEAQIDALGEIINIAKNPVRAPFIGDEAHRRLADILHRAERIDDRAILHAEVGF